MSHISFYVAARCEKAGRKVNQDSVLVCPDVANLPDDAFTSNFDTGTLYTQSEAGTLLVVADGMGGMNAGEKASELVIAGVKKKFENVPVECLSDRSKALAFMTASVDYADSIIKQYAQKHPETRGMGSTIVMVWLLGGEALCLWCGDSRIYRYNPANGIVRLSHDHSYVQALVDNGKIDPEDAFDHPDSNIITRSLGDSGEKPNPDTAYYKVYDNDIFLLCSDGLHGLLPENPDIREILDANSASVSKALEALWKAGEQKQFTDNCTIILCRIAEGGAMAPNIVEGYPEVIPPKTRRAKHIQSGGGNHKNTSTMTDEEIDALAREHEAQKALTARPAHNNGKKTWIILAAVCLTLLGVAWFLLPRLYSTHDRPESSKGRTIVTGTIDPEQQNEMEEDNYMSNMPTNRRDNTDDRIGDSQRHQHEAGDNAYAQSSSRQAPATYVGQVKTLYSQIPIISTIVLKSDFTDSNKKKITNFVDSVVKLIHENDAKHYDLDADTSKMLAELNDMAGRAYESLRQPGQ